jgi:hypothetical protein
MPKIGKCSLGLLAGTLVATGLASVPAAAASLDVSAGSTAVHPMRTEAPVRTSAPVPGVLESVVRLRIPLPASVGPHPAACDWLSYLRYRSAAGPTKSARADRILVAQPGILEGAGAFDSVASNTVAAAARRGRHIEFWALDRRSNCLEDHTGVLAGVAAKDPHVAVDYYYRHKVIDGRTFAGYQTSAQVGWLAHVGIEQTVRDEYDLLRAELPDQKVRKQKVLCGGHSLGGIVTGFFAEWDFDGNPATTADAGYNQCAGYFALDTSIDTSLAGLSGVASSKVYTAQQYAHTQQLLIAGTLPRTLSAPVLINPATMNLLGITGLAADVKPGALSDLASYVPSNFNINETLRLLFAGTYRTFLTGVPAVTDLRLTNEAALGEILDNNAQPLAFLQASVGFPTGGPLTQKTFPVPADIAKITGLSVLAASFGPDAKATPAAVGPLYTWHNYDQIPAAGTKYRTTAGAPFTTPAKEVTDISELARSLTEQPLDFTEQYFPFKLVSDIQQATAPQIARQTSHPRGIYTNPTINLLGGSGLVVATGKLPHGQNVVVPGYHHLDLLTAAPVQNNGKPEAVSTALAAFAGCPTCSPA